MERKLGRTATIAPEEVKASLSKEGGLTAEEEKVLRMSHGISVEPDSPLGKAASGSAELADELLLMEMNLFRVHRPTVTGRRARPTTTSAAAPGDSRAKSKIIRALRRKR
jgi:hypothetical protein